MATRNTFPAPIGPTSAHTGLGSLVTTTKNFYLTPGLWVISLELLDTDGDAPNVSVSLQTSTGTSGLSDGTSTAVLTMTQSGYYNFVVPAGPRTLYNFTSTNPIKNVRATKVDVSIGPS